MSDNVNEKAFIVRYGPTPGNERRILPGIAGQFDDYADACRCADNAKRQLGKRARVTIDGDEAELKAAKAAMAEAKGELAEEDEECAAESDT